MSWNHCLEGYFWLSDFFDRWASSRKTREQIERQQRRRFRKLVHFANRRSPYYAGLLSRLRLQPDTCCLNDFPILTKKQVMKHFDDIVTDRNITKANLDAFISCSSDPTELFRNNYYVVHTSGSSGQVGYFIYRSREWIRGCSHQIRFLGRLGVRTRTAFVAAANGHYTGVTLALTGSRLINRLFFRPRAFDINQPTDEIVHGLNRFQPHVLIAYGAALYLLAVEQAEGRLQIAPQRLISSGEPLLSGSRRFIEETFAKEVINVYASSEHLFMGISTGRDNAMYLLEDDLIFEPHDDHVCVTNLFNRTLPLIRYRMDDVLSPIDNASSNHPFRTVKNIVGRVERPIVLKNQSGDEDFIHPLVITEIVAPHLLAFQIKIIDNSQFVFRVQLEPRITQRQKNRARDEITDCLRKILAAKQMDQSVQFEIQEVDSFEVEKSSGKFRLIETDRTYESLVHPPLEKVA